MSRYNNPCRAQIIVRIDGAQKSITIPYCGYGTQRHIDRWAARGAQRVVVIVTSHSTGRVCDRDEWNRDEAAA